MKRFLLFCLIVQIGISANAQNISKDKVSELRQLIMAVDSISNRLLQALPSTFDEFDKIFGYSSTNKGELSDGVSIISRIQNNNHLDVNLLCEKLVSIAASPNSHWQADQIGYVHDTLLFRVTANPKIIFTLLNKLDRKSTEQFWHFAFDGPHPSNYKSHYIAAIKFAIQENYPYLDIIKRSYASHLKREQDEHR